MKKLKTMKVKMVALALALYGALGAAYAHAAESATSTMDTVGGSILDSVIAVVTKFFTSYWPYILVFGVLFAVAGYFVRSARGGFRR